MKRGRGRPHAAAAFSEAPTPIGEIEKAFPFRPFFCF